MRRMGSIKTKMKILRGPASRLGAGQVVAVADPFYRDIAKLWLGGLWDVSAKRFGRFETPLFRLKSMNKVAQPQQAPDRNRRQSDRSRIGQHRKCR